jgi:cytochrome c peroxidase
LRRKRNSFLLLCGGLCAVFISLKAKDSLHPYPFPSMVHFPEMPQNPDNPVTVEGSELGRFLFYDSILSLDYSLACASCHQQKFAFSDGPKRFSTGFQGQLQTRNSPGLFNLAWYEAYFWDGRSPTLEDQALHPVRSHAELNLDWKTAMKRIAKSDFYRPLFAKVFGTRAPDSTQIAMAIAQFERTLLSHNAKFDSVFRREAYFTADEYAGFLLVNDQTRGDCLHCHTTDSDGRGTTGRFSNNGLDAAERFADFRDPGKAAFSSNPKESGHFKIPSLRNLAYTAPYMHDGRFSTLEEVMKFYSEEVKISPTIDSKMTHQHKGGAHFSAQEMRQIIAFLNTLNDPVFVEDEKFASPFKSRKPKTN